MSAPNTPNGQQPPRSRADSTTNSDGDWDRMIEAKVSPWLKRHGRPIGAAIRVALLSLGPLAVVQLVGYTPTFLAIASYVVFGVLVLALLLSAAVSPTGRAWQRLFLPIPAFLAVVVAVGEAEASPRFFETAAQVIPVLVIAIALENRAFRPEGPWMPARMYAATTLVIVAWGEYEALRAISAGGEGDTAVVSGALAAAGVSLISAALFGPNRKTPGYLELMEGTGNEPRR